MSTSKAKAFTLVELLVVVAIIALLLSILLPALGRAKGVAQVTVCAANLKQLSSGLQIYSIENKGFMPHSIQNGAVADLLNVEMGSWMQRITDLTDFPMPENNKYEKRNIWWCPLSGDLPEPWSDPVGFNFQYAMNAHCYTKPNRVSRGKIEWKADGSPWATNRISDARGSLVTLTEGPATMYNAGNGVGFHNRVSTWGWSGAKNSDGRSAQWMDTAWPVGARFNPLGRSYLPENPPDGKIHWHNGTTNIASADASVETLNFWDLDEMYFRMTTP